MEAAVIMPKVRKSRKKLSIGMIVVYIILIAWALINLFACVWVVVNSFKQSGDVVRSSFSLPEVFRFTT